MAGPLAPAVGGMASVIDALQRSSLAQGVDLRLFQTGKTTAQNRSLWQGVSARSRLMWAWWRLVGDKPRPIAHIHTCSGFSFFLDGALLLCARLRGTATVLHIHGGRFDSFLDGLGPALSLVARWLARRAQVVVVLSEDWQRRLEPRLPGVRWAVLRNGVAVKALTPAGQRAGPPRFLFLGGMSRAKGIDVLLQAVANASGDWQLVMAGAEGEPGFIAWMHSEIGRLDIGSRVQWLGEVVGAAKDSALAASDIFVLPSRAEGLPMAMLECMGAGMAVVATRVGAIPEVITEGREGLLVPSGDAAALAAAMDRLASDADLRQRMGAAARRTCEDQYSVESAARKLMLIYQALPARPS
jgi:glycosyltransferase involved in cell wall biosynthesis